MIGLLLAAAALSPALSQQLHDAFAPGDAPASFAPLLSIDDGTARVLVVCGEGGAPRPLLARVEGDRLLGDPVEIGAGFAGHTSCGEVRATSPFALRRGGTNAGRAVVLSFRDGGAPYLAAAVSLKPAVLTWTDAKGATIEAKPGARDTAFCALQRDGSFRSVAWSPEVGEYAPGAPCRAGGKNP